MGPALPSPSPDPRPWTPNPPLQCAVPSSPFPIPQTIADRLATALADYEKTDNLGALIDHVRAIATDSNLDQLLAAAEPHRDRPEVMIPVYEHVVARRPTDARALVVLANAYWLTGRGPDVVGELAQRAKSADPENRAAWHLWALSESQVRARVERWQQVAERFPADQLARAALADNATSLASAEHDPLALDLAIRIYQGLWQEAPTPTQRRALEETLETLRKWKL